MILFWRHIIDRISRHWHISVQSHSLYDCKMGKICTLLAIAAIICMNFAHTCSSTSPEFFQSSLSQPSRPIKDREGRLRGIHSYDETDFILGVLIPVHNSAENSSGGRCGNTLTAQGVQRVEVTLYAIDRINSDPELLSNLTLGYDIRDTCFSENIALDETIDVLVEESELQLESCDTTSTNESESFLLGMVGSPTSGVTVPVASMLRLFMITQVSYLATSPLLNNRDRYRYFLRTVPPDNIQAAAMYQLALRFDWTLVSVIHSNDPYGSYAAREFRKLSIENNESVCIDFDASLDVSFTEDQYRKIAFRFVRDSQANVVAIFSAVTVAVQFLKALENTTTQRKYLFFASDTITDSASTIKRFNRVLSGMFAFYPHSEPFAEFETFYRTVTLSNNERNRKWYEEECVHLYKERCQGNSSVGRDPGYVPDVSGSLLVDAIYSFAHGIDRYLKENCAQPVVWNRTTKTCQGQNRTLTRELLLEYVQMSNFQSPTGFHVMFDKNGSRESAYSIFNLQRNNTNGYIFPIVGSYDPVNNNIQINTSNVQFGPFLDRGRLQSQCRVCDPGSVFMPVQGSCCGICQPCRGNTSTNSSNGTSASTCSACGQQQWGNNPLNGSTSCEPLDESFISYSDVWGAIIIVLSIWGLLLVILVCIGMGIFWNTPVVKSSGREQMVVLLIGLICCFLLPYFYIIKPSLGICIVRRLGVSFCFSLVFGALLVKLIRIARIFLQRQKAGRPRFIEPHYQIIFTLFIVAGQMILAVISLIVVYPTTTTDVRSNPDDSNNFPTLILTCQSPHLAPLILLVLYDTILIILNNVLAVFTIRFPENFNEARHVSFSTFAIAVIWLGFISSYFATQIEFRGGVVGFAVLMSAFAVLLCLFGPRIILVILHHWRKSQNQDGPGHTYNTNTNSRVETETTLNS